MEEQGSIIPTPPPPPAPTTAAGLASPVARRTPRGIQAALALTALAWSGAAGIIARNAAHGLAVRFQLGSVERLLVALFSIFLLVIGFRALDLVAARGWQRVDPLPLPRRAGWPREFGVGAAVGWGLSLVVVLPALFSLNLHTRLAAGPLSILPTLIALLTIMAAALVQELIFRGYPFYRLSAALGSTAAALLLSMGYAITLLGASPPRHPLFALLSGLCLGLLLTLAYLRTHALWLGWGLHFAYWAITAIVLGLPVIGRGEYGSFTDTYITGPAWLSGGVFGLDDALLTSGFLLLAFAIVYQVTRDYAWNYTHRPIVSAGYAVTVAPPAAHTAMERASAPAPLVQILATTPTNFSRNEPPPPPPRD